MKLCVFVPLLYVTVNLCHCRTSETNESSIIYTPDDGDDFDEEEEDPDDDLCI